MYTLCADDLRVLESHEYLSHAKNAAVLRSEKYPASIYFVCNPSGEVIAGYGPHPDYTKRKAVAR